MTGAPMPPGADVIVQVERTDGGVQQVRIDSAPAPGVHVRTMGEDVTAGAVVLPAGTVIGPPQIGVAAALGFAELPVRLPLRVLVLSTGTELVEPGQPLGPGQIYESNAPMLAAAIAAVGARCRRSSISSPMTSTSSARCCRPAATDTDLIVTSGGVSAGAYEVVKDALTGHGIEFAKVGDAAGDAAGRRPLRTAGGRSVPVVTLPGNPVSSYVSFEVFLRPAIRAAMGHPDVTRPVVERAADHRHRLPGRQAAVPPRTPGRGRRHRRALGRTRVRTCCPGWPGADCMIVIARGRDAPGRRRRGRGLAAGLSRRPHDLRAVHPDRLGISRYQHRSDATLTTAEGRSVPEGHTIHRLSRDLLRSFGRRPVLHRRCRTGSRPAPR